VPSRRHASNLGPETAEGNAYGPLGIDWVRRPSYKEGP
jgi:hypothetical protein